MWFQDVFRFDDDQELMDLWQKCPSAEKADCIRLYAAMLFAYVVDAKKERGENNDE